MHAAVEFGILAVEKHVLVPVDREPRLALGRLAAIERGVAGHVHRAGAFDFGRVFFLIDRDLGADHDQLPKAQLGGLTGIAEHEKSIATRMVDQVEHFSLDVHALAGGLLVLGRLTFLVNVDRALRDQLLQLLLVPLGGHIGDHVVRPQLDRLAILVASACGRVGCAEGAGGWEPRAALPGGAWAGGNTSGNWPPRLFILEADAQVIGVVHDHFRRTSGDLFERLDLVHFLLGTARDLAAGARLARSGIRFQPHLEPLRMRCLLVLFIDERGVAGHRQNVQNAVAVPAIQNGAK